jgi:4-amino-4-deoxy-L-arabinose transferase-like glycosyltransferase
MTTVFCRFSLWGRRGPSITQVRHASHVTAGCALKLDYFDTIAARSDAAPARWRRPLLRVLDGIERGWAIPALIGAFAGAWFVFLLIAYLSGDLHVDALETWSLGREFAWGNAKHPPLMGWVAYLWTLVFPLTDWSFQLLAMTNAAVALYAVDLIARRFVRGDKRAIVLLLLMLLPAYQFHAQRFNANTVLLAIWPLATYCFLRAFQSRGFGWSIAAGVMTALAMLGKYYSIFLVGSFVLAALAHPDRKIYFKSWSPWLSSLAGLIVLGPHLHWLATHGAKPFEYALQVHGGYSTREAFWEATKFVGGLLATLALPAVCWVLAAGPKLKRTAADLAALDPGLWLLFLIGLFTLLLPALTAIVVGTDMPSLWALQGLFLLALIIVCGARFPVERFHTVNLMVGVVVFAVIAIVVAAPYYAYERHVRRENDRAFYRIAANEITQRWHALTDAPLPVISGSDDLAFATAFYSADHPRYSRPFRLQYTWPVPPQNVLARGWAALCFAEDTPCVSWMDQVKERAPNATRAAFTARPTLLGYPGATAAIQMLIVPPEAKKARARDGVAPTVALDELGASRR